MIQLRYSRSILFVFSVLLIGCSTASQVDRGVSYYNQGRYDDALIQWHYPAQQGDYAAQHNMGLIYKDGLGSSPKNLNMAAEWFLLSAKQGYSPAMVRLAEVQTQLGNEAPANTWLNLAARWGNVEAISQLQRKGLKVPTADLQYAQQQQNAQALQTLATGMVMLQAMDAMNNSQPVTNTYSQRQSSSSSYTATTSVKGCVSDYACGIGFTCVKAPYSSEGQCMKTVNQYGTQQFNQPDPKSIGIKSTGDCMFDTQCPVGFRCDQTLKSCVK